MTLFAFVLFFCACVYVCLFVLMTFRRDSFITHRAFCDALAEESARAVTTGIGIANNNPLVIPSPTPQIPAAANSSHVDHHHHMMNLQLQAQDYPSKKEEHIEHHQNQNFNLLPPWLGPPPNIDISFSSSSPRMEMEHQDLSLLHENPNPRLGPTSTTLSAAYHQTASAPSPHMSATALLQKAAQMGATMSMTTTNRPHHQTHVSVADSANNNSNINFSNNGNFGLNLSSRDQDQLTTTTSTSTSLLHHVINTTFSSSSSSSGFQQGTSFENIANFGGILNSNKRGNNNYNNSLTKTTTAYDGGAGAGGNEALSTRDFLGHRPLSHTEILTIAGMGKCINSSPPQKPWQG